MAGTTGLEPAASAVTGQRSNQLNYVPTRQINKMRIASVYAALNQSHTSAAAALDCSIERDFWLNRHKS
jgi:hypothetical protein